MNNKYMPFLMHEAAHAFYAWEKSKYGDHSPLSDDDRIMWMQGFIHAQDMEKVKREINRLMLERNVGDEA